MNAMVGEVLLVGIAVGRSRPPALAVSRSDTRRIRGRKRLASRRWTKAHRASGSRILERQQLVHAGLENGRRDLTPRRSDKSGPPCLANRPSSLATVGCELSDPDGPGGGKEGRLAVRRSSSSTAPRVNQTLESLPQNSGGYCRESRDWLVAAALTFSAVRGSCESWCASCLF